MNKAAQSLGRLGGKAGTGAAKVRSTSFTAASSQKALAARWATHRKSKRVARRSNAAKLSHGSTTKKGANETE